MARIENKDIAHKIRSNYTKFVQYCEDNGLDRSDPKMLAKAQREFVKKALTRRPGRPSSKPPTPKRGYHPQLVTVAVLGTDDAGRRVVVNQLKDIPYRIRRNVALELEHKAGTEGFSEVETRILASVNGD